MQEGGRWQGASEDWSAGSEDEEGQTPSRVRSRLNVDDAKAAEAKDDSMKICRARLGRLRAAYLSAQWRTSRHGIQKEDSQHSGVLTSAASKAAHTEKAAESWGGYIVDIVFERPYEVPVEALRRELVLRVRNSGGEVLSDGINSLLSATLTS